VRLEGLGQLKNQMTSSRFEPATLVPQPTTLPRAPCNEVYLEESPTSRLNVSPTHSWFKSNPRKKPAETGCLLDLLFYHEDDNDMVLRNVGLYPNYTALQPKRP
jgi:hypothetical protein